MQQYTVYLYLKTALHVSGSISTHHQELISLYLQYLAVLRPLLLPVLPVVRVTGWELVPIQSRSRQVAVKVSIMPDTVDTVIWAPDDWWRYQPKHAQQFADINKLYIVASYWIIIDTVISNFMQNLFSESRFFICEWTYRFTALKYCFPRIAKWWILSCVACKLYLL